jgi:Protein of unknown function (DUF3237)
MVGLEQEMTYRVRVTGPLETTTGAPTGERQYWQVDEATLSGDRIEARLAMPGGDWMLVGPDGYWRPDVRVQLVTADDAVVLLHYTGLVEQTDRFVAAAAAGRETGWDDQYMRMALRFETGAERYAWLVRNLFVAAGRLVGPGEIEYRVFRLT